MDCKVHVKVKHKYNISIWRKSRICNHKPDCLSTESFYRCGCTLLLMHQMSFLFLRKKSKHSYIYMILNNLIYTQQIFTFDR